MANDHSPAGITVYTALSESQYGARGLLGENWGTAYSPTHTRRRAAQRLVDFEPVRPFPSLGR